MTTITCDGCGTTDFPRRFTTTYAYGAPRSWDLCKLCAVKVMTAIRTLTTCDATITPQHPNP